MDDLHEEELSAVVGGDIGNTMRTIGLLTTLSVGEKLDELVMPRILDPNPITMTMEPIKPNPLPGGAEIKGNRR